MRVLIIKMSSMGDILHTLPAITDAKQAIPDIEFDWVVEEAFAEIPAWHPAVQQVIPIAWRRWRKKIFSLFFNPEWKRLRHLLREHKYDYIIDAQGLIKSAVITRMAHGFHCGFDRKSIREPLASFFYNKSFAVKKSQHAITRARELFAEVLSYTFDKKKIDYGINQPTTNASTSTLPKNYSIFIPNTSQANKRWSIAHWRTLLTYMQTAKQTVVIPAGYAHEHELVQQITADFNNVTILPKNTLQQILTVIANSQVIVSVDTGLAHLAAALNKPTITLYGPTDTHLIGTVGQQQIHLTTNANNVDTLPEHVWQQLQPFILKRGDDE